MQAGRKRFDGTQLAVMFRYTKQQLHAQTGRLHCVQVDMGTFDGSSSGGPGLVCMTNLLPVLTNRNSVVGLGTAGETHHAKKHMHLAFQDSESLTQHCAVCLSQADSSALCTSSPAAGAANRRMMPLGRD